MPIPLQKLLQNDTMWLRDTGVLVKMKYDVLKREIPIPMPKVWKDQPLNLLQLGIIMIVLGVGILSSMLAFLFELRKTNVAKSGSNQSCSSKEVWIECRIMEKVVEGGGTRNEGIECIEIF